MKALLLSAGLGTRLRPITDTIPKCLVKIKGTPLLDIWINNLLNIGVNQILINTHYLHKEVEEFLYSRDYKDKIVLTYEPELLGTAGTLIKNADFFLDEDSFFLIHADNYCTANLNEFLSIHQNSSDEIQLTMMTFRTDCYMNCGIVEIDNNNIMNAFYEKSIDYHGDLANGAVYILKKKLLKYIIDKRSNDFSNDVIPSLLGRVLTYENKKIHIDIGTVENLIKANKL